MKNTAPMLSFLLLIALLLPASATANPSNIDADQAFVWSETAGWLHFHATHGSVEVLATHLRGFAWSENLGWIKLGATGAGPYANTSATDWGVNRAADGSLSGYAWSETAGWINFDSTDGQVTIDPTTKRFDGFAWAGNVGWIHFRNDAVGYGLGVLPGSPDAGFLLNPNFDDELAPWSSFDFVWSDQDVDAIPSSGSAEVLLPDADRLLVHPCIDVAGEIALEARLSARIADPTFGTPRVALALIFYDSADCGGSTLGTAVLATIKGDTVGAWVETKETVQLPVGTLSALPAIAYAAAGSSPTEVLVDRVYLVAAILADGFESGDMTLWSVVVP